MFKNVSLSLLSAICFAFGAGQAAQALTFVEGRSDAGEALATAADTTTSGVVGLLTSIEGRITSGADLYKILVPEGNFVASTLLEDLDSGGTVTNGGTIGDTQLFLFTSDGRGIVQNDDVLSRPSSLRSKISVFLTAGTYYLGITKFNYDPFSGGNSLSPVKFSGNFTGGSNVLTQWAGVRPRGLKAYEIALSSTPIPSPALLPGLVGLGMGVYRKRKATIDP